MDLEAFLTKISYWAIPSLFAITLHEVAHGWAARYFGDRTAQMLGRLSLNPLRHIDPVGTVVVPALLLAIGAPVIGWAKAVPVATSALRNPRRAMMSVAFAGPAANLLMALFWSGVLGGILRAHGTGALATLVTWVASMAEAGIWVNVVLAVLNLLPVPPLDGGRILVAMLPSQWGSRLEKIEPFGMIFVLGLCIMRWLDWLFIPAFRITGRFMGLLLGASA